MYTPDGDLNFTFVKKGLVLLPPPNRRAAVRSEMRCSTSKSFEQVVPTSWSFKQDNRSREKRMEDAIVILHAFRGGASQFRFSSIGKIIDRGRG